MHIEFLVTYGLQSARGHFGQQGQDVRIAPECETACLSLMNFIEACDGRVIRIQAVQVQGATASQIIETGVGWCTHCEQNKTSVEVSFVQGVVMNIGSQIPAESR